MANRFKKLVALSLSIIMVMGIIPFSAFSVFADVPSLWDGSIADKIAIGSGTENDPYIITNGAELAYLNILDTDGKYFELANDIVLNDTSSANWYEHATQWGFIDRFRGDFNGNGYTISGIYINPDVIDEHASNYGLFGTTENAVIKNVNVTNSYITGSYCLGGIVGYAKNTEISGCSFNGTIKAFTYEVDLGDGEVYSVDGKIAGGIVGLTYSGGGGVCIIDQCKNYGEIYAETEDSGGIVGLLENESEIYNCENHGKVYGYTYVGGIVGTAWGTYGKPAILESCRNYGSVTTDVENANKIGGIAGGLLTASMKYCINYGNVGIERVIYTQAIGGVVGYASLANYMEWCVNYGTVTGLYDFGGVIGYQAGYTEDNGDGTINHIDLEAKYLINRGKVCTVDYTTDFPVPSNSNAGVAGGIVGFTSYGRYSYVYNYGAIYGYDYIGGIVGRTDTVNIEKAYNNGHIQGRNYVGGIVGKTFILYYGDIVISDSVNNGEIYGHHSTGGIIGESYDNRYDYGQMNGLDVYSCGIEITRVQNNGSIYSYTSAGGVIGGAGYTIIEDAVNLGDVNVYYDDGYDFSWCGGIIGYVYSTSQIVLNNSFSMGDLNYPATPEEYYDRYIGGVIGYVLRDSTAILSNNYYFNPNLSGIGMCEGKANDSAIKALSESNISNQSNFENFNFENVWIIKDGCPQIRNLPESFLGNVNGDGNVDKKDYATLKRYCFGSTQLSQIQLLAADVNKDGEVNKKDYAILKRYCFGAIELN